MRVTIEHREKPAGFSGNERRYFVDCAIEFSEEEKSIIKQRGLGDRYIKTESDIPTGGGIADFTWANTGLRMLSRLLVLGGIAAIILGMVGNRSALNFPTPLFVGAFLVFLYRKYAERRSTASYEERRITVRQLLKDPRFTVYAPDPAVAKGLEHNIREQLVDLKEIIQGSAEVPKKQTFEL